MGLSGQSDKNGQTANKDRGLSTLTLNTLLLFFQESWRAAREEIRQIEKEGGKERDKQK